ncbi:hypothetical protein AVEN_106712-1 [Araneus ventricosus]|uniref:Uncharacterized protein n=1 Tax=Araneus ventricosus TaxID=182803 RepID=A0A4Y2EYW5_ARAVE|nr:hypothetical protein AVEN_106712-1 [Araneus ventricosus]
MNIHIKSPRPGSRPCGVSERQSMQQLQCCGRSPSNHHRPRPDHSRRRHALSLAEGKKPQPLSHPPGKRDPAFLSGGFSSMHWW